MFQLRIVQALSGDCFLLDYGTPEQPRHLLVDGGPETVFPAYLRPLLATMAGNGGSLDCVILSHADDDHVIGLVNLFTELTQEHRQGQPALIGVREVWINTFDLDGAPVPAAVYARAPRPPGPASAPAPAAEDVAPTPVPMEGIAEGIDVRRLIADLGIPCNTGFQRSEVALDTAPGPVTLGNLTLHVIGPTESNLARLRREWQAWLVAHGQAAVTPAAAPDLRAAVARDQSVPNRGSIMFLADADGRRILFTGDGRGDHIIQGLVSGGFMPKGGVLHVDVLKLPHHGSARNVTRAFFRQVTADVYVISADGRYGNPDLATLIWLVEAIKEQGRQARLVVTNPTTAVSDLQRDYPPADYGYQVQIADASQPAYSLTLS